MRECSYELYLAIYHAVRAGIAEGDKHIIGRISRHIAGRDAETTLVMTLGLIEARRGDPPRQREQVCDGVLCRQCAKSGATAREHEAGGTLRLLR